MQDPPPRHYARLHGRFRSAEHCRCPYLCERPALCSRRGATGGQLHRRLPRLERRGRTGRPTTAVPSEVRRDRLPRRHVGEPPNPASQIDRDHCPSRPRRRKVQRMARRYRTSRRSCRLSVVALHLTSAPPQTRQTARDGPHAPLDLALLARRLITTRTPAPGGACVRDEPGRRLSRRHHQRLTPRALDP